MNVDKSQQSYRYPSFSIRRCCDMSIKKKYRKFCSVLFLGLQSSSWALNFGFRKKHKIHNTQSIIGDSSRDFLSSTVFFDSIDRDGDGTLRHKELFNYILQSIGGSDFDIKAEVEYEISTMMEKFDINLDQGLDNKDFNSFWKVLDNLLTVEEVADWIMYACQLPEEIGEIFRKHHVTGYDFPELVENEGQSLQSELNISNTRWRNTIVRMVRARILGIGVNPSAPNKFTYHVQDCDAVKIEWTKCEAKRGFPVHGYRVQRRRVIGAGFNENYITNKNINNENCDWQTIYSGVDTDVVNTGLEYEQYISFRVQSWSSIGKSEWMYIDINLNKKRRKLKCKPINYEDNPMKNYSAKKNSPLLTFNVVINFIYVIGKIFICIFGLLATTLKVLSTPSTQQYDEFVNATKLKVYRKLKQEDTITNKINRTNSISSYTTNYNWKWNSKNKEEVSLFSLIDHVSFCVQRNSDLLNINTYLLIDSSLYLFLFINLPAHFEFCQMGS